MNKPNMAALFKNVKMVLSNHSPEILTGLEITRMITTIILTFSSSPYALDLIAETKEKNTYEGHK